jgi:hypothetical protein
MLSLVGLALSTCSTTQVEKVGEPVLAAGRVEMEEGGFSFQPIAGYIMEIDQHVAVMNDKRKNNHASIIISLLSRPNGEDMQSQEERLDAMMKTFFTGKGTYVKGPVSATMIDGIQGVSVDTAGMLFGKSFRGQTILVSPNESQDMIGVCITNTSVDSHRWENEGSKAFHAVLNSVKFTPTGESPVGRGLTSSWRRVAYGNGVDAANHILSSQKNLHSSG